MVAFSPYAAPIYGPSQGIYDYMSVLAEADRAGSVDPMGQPTGAYPDGRLTQQELGNYIMVINQQLQFIQQQYGGSANPFIQQYVSGLVQKLNIAVTMFNNFQRFSRGGGIPGGQAIDSNSLMQTASADGNPYDVSAYDLSAPPSPGGMLPPGGNGGVFNPNLPIQQLDQRFLLLMEQLFPGLGPISQTIKYLGGQLINLDPASPQAGAILNRIQLLASQFPEHQGAVNTMMNVYQYILLEKIIVSLKTALASLPPGSPQYVALQTRIETLERYKAFMANGLP